MTVTTSKSLNYFMKTVGQILKETREAKFYTLEEVEKATKIQKKMLEYLESDDYTKLPPATFVQGFIKNYAKFLNLDAQKLLAVFRREFSTDKNRIYIMDTFSKPIKTSPFSLTPSRIISLVVISLILVFMGYLWVQYRGYVGPPPLSVTSPVEGQTVDNPNIIVEGSTEPETKVLVNSQEVPVDNMGHFKIEVGLSSAVNKIEVEAFSKFKQTSTVTRTVYLKR